MKKVEVSITNQQLVLLNNPAAIAMVQKRLNEMCEEWNRQIDELARQIKGLSTNS